MKKNLIVALLVMAPVTSNAGLIIVDDVLMGATDVIVGSETYDVSFHEGSCNSLFNGCDPAEFAFWTLAEAEAAGNALLEQVFIDSAAGSFDSETDHIFGCVFVRNCLTRIPFAAAGGSVSQVVVANAAAGLGSDFLFNQSLGADNDSSAFTNVNFARFTPVPEPGTVALLAIGLAVAGFAHRRKA